MQRIEADVLIPGRGTPIDDGCVLIDHTTITYAGSIEEAPASPSATVTRVPAVMPGMWDCHTHFTGLTTPNIDEAPRIPHVLAGVRSARDAEAALSAGFTSLREAGGYGVFLARAVAEGTVVGPNIYAAGSILSTTGGHGDLHSYPLDWVLDYETSGGWLSICDGVAECLKATRKQLRRNAKVIKVCASGGVMSEIDDPVHQQFSAEELRAIVEEAARAERVVMAHCHGTPGIKAALDAGVSTIEHGTYLDEETAAQMKEQEAILVPTRFIVERLLAGGRESGMPEYAYRKLVEIGDRHMQAISLAHEVGVTIALGTDIATSGADSAVPWGANGEEVIYLERAGLSPLEIIETATANGPATLGPQAPNSGRLAAGFDADIIAVCANPLDDIALLADPTNIVKVWKGGSLVKGS
ncbi:imidazolonepropionase [bacterium BMS3Abin02]|nr:imidazolonepropionase [bacterium BMS3Abin02]GBE22095.1 imidazolonepropionase [bacterium BMS3Bbin01]